MDEAEKAILYGNPAELPMYLLAVLQRLGQLGNAGKEAVAEFLTDRADDEDMQRGIMALEDIFNDG